jgi:hypothetical protein
MNNNDDTLFANDRSRILKVKRAFYVSCLLVFTSFFSLNAQTFDKKRLEFGGSLGASFGDYTSVNISPQIGYSFSKLFSAGIGLNYLYYSYDDNSINYAGFDLYAHLRPVQNIILLAQPEFYRNWGSYITSRFVPCLLLGGGVVLPIGSSGGVSMTLSYDVLQNDYSPYRNNVVYSVGYIIRL